MRISRVSYSEALKKMDMKNSLLLTGIDNLEHINFCMYFDLSKGQVYVTGHPTVIETDFDKNPVSILVFDFYPEYGGILFSNVRSRRVTRILFNVGNVILRDFECGDLVSELERNLPVKKIKVYNMLTNNGLIALSKKVPDYLSRYYSKFYSTKVIPVADGARSKKDKWEKRIF